VVTGRLKQRSFETREGEKRTVFEVECDDVAPSLKNATAKVQRAERSRPQPGSTAAAEDPWSAGASGASDEPPF
jgi:single-strand DNA-binding protein